MLRAEGGGQSSDLVCAGPRRPLRRRGNRTKREKGEDGWKIERRK
jgi:hypothetical protein